MQTIAVVGLDLAKTVFQVHGVAADGTVVVRRQLRRGQVLGFFQSIGPCLVGIEACASAHHWARELMLIGHEVRLMPPAYVKAYVKRGKTDAADAEAIAEAVTRPTMRFVAVKSKAQQAVLMLHKTRDLLVRQRTMLINALRGHLGEFGIVAPQGPAGVQTALKALREEEQDLPDPTLFRSGRQFAAWLGLTPRANSSGGKERQGGISKMGDSYLRRLLVVGATAVLRMARQRGREGWVGNLLERKKPKVAAVALANKTARIAWSLMARQEDYRPMAA